MRKPDDDPHGESLGDLEPLLDDVLETLRRALGERLRDTEELPDGDGGVEALTETDAQLEDETDGTAVRDSDGGCVPVLDTQGRSGRKVSELETEVVIEPERDAEMVELAHELVDSESEGKPDAVVQTVVVPEREGESVALRQCDVVPELQGKTDTD